MRTNGRIFGGYTLGAAALAALAWGSAGSTAIADDGPPGAACRSGCTIRHAHSAHRGPGLGTLGYGPPGLHPGFQGFGLNYHRGYGYGGDALGPGAEGGYPHYGGPGYPQPNPPLRRFKRILPFVYNAGPGYAAPEGSIYYQEPGPLTVDRPVIPFRDEVGGPSQAAGFGQYTGAIPYPPSTFAPYTTTTEETAETAPRPAAPPFPTP